MEKSKFYLTERPSYYPPIGLLIAICYSKLYLKAVVVVVVFCSSITIWRLLLERDISISKIFRACSIHSGVPHANSSDHQALGTACTELEESEKKKEIFCTGPCNPLKLLKINLIKWIHNNLYLKARQIYEWLVWKVETKYMEPCCHGNVEVKRYEGSKYKAIGSWC